MNKRYPLISIIIPAYNTADVILATLHSVEKQTYPHYEMIIINDGSTDNTQEILEHYQTTNQKVIIYHQKNAGVSAARNKGIELAQGEFLSFLDSDDTYSPLFLEQMLQRQQETGATAVYCSYHQIDKQQNTLLIKNSFDEGHILKSFFGGHCYFLIPCILIKRSFILEKNIFFEVGQKIAEDEMFLVKLMNNTRFYAVSVPLFNYFYRTNSAMNAQWSRETWLYQITGLNKIHDYLSHYYNEMDKREVLQLVRLKIFITESNFLSHCLKSWQYMEVRHYLINNNFYAKKDLLPQVSSGRKRLFSTVKSNRLIIWLLYTLYYKFLRYNLHQLKLRFQIELKK